MNHSPDWDYWTRLDLWTAAQAAMLLLGRDPLNALACTDEEYAKLLSLIRTALDAGVLPVVNPYDVIFEAFAGGRDPRLDCRPFRPCDLVAWAQSKQLHIPEPLTRAFAGMDLKGETAAHRRERLKKRVEAEKANGNRAFLKTVAEEDGIGVSRLKQLLRGR